MKRFDSTKPKYIALFRTIVILENVFQLNRKNKCTSHLKS
jgi:hypothetical protein